jgi:hypothetical protein
MKIIEIEITGDRRGKALVQRGQFHRRHWRSMEKNFTTNRWQLKSSNIDIHDRVVELEIKNQFKILDCKEQ